MIYLIDDRKQRQEEQGGWNTVKFSEYSDYIKPIYNYDELSKLSNEIFSSNNIVLFHESFIDFSSRSNISLIKDFEINLINEVKRNNGFKLVYFSGSKKFRNLKDEIGYLPVEIVYQNLSAFINKIKEGIIDLKYLLYGNNHQIEETLYNQLKLKNESIEDLQINNNKFINFVAKSLDQEIDDPFTNAINAIIFGDEITDEYLNEITIEWFSENEYDNIFIPLCFGSTLSDYNGLRLATHIRCSETINQLKPIFIYSFVDYSYLIENEYFDVLKTKNIFLIEYSKQAFKNALELNISSLHLNDISKEIKKINLQIPANYEDNHSIANEWAIYRWSRAIDANDDSIDKVKGIQKSNLYFKYLKTIYPVSHLDKLTSAQLKINYQDNPKVLYIDDEGEKGWYEIFCKILDDENKLFFRYLDDEFNEKSKEEIIDISIKKIIDEDFDLVILDFRLHKNDFENIKIKDVTGYQILKKIKEYNNGIQVVIFSATNKIWNLQALQEAGADGFIIKESPENSIDTQFTKQSIENFISISERCLKRNFLKYFFSTCDKIGQNISNCYSDPQSPFDLFKKEIILSLKIICESVYNIDLNLNSTVDVVFLNCYNFLEKFKHFYIKEINYKLVIGCEELEMNRYNFSNKLNDEGKFIRININDNPSFFHSVVALLIDYFKIINSTDIIIKKVYEIKEARNNYIHGNKANFNVTEILDIINICKTITVNLKE